MRRCKLINEIFEKNNSHEYKNIVIYTKGFKTCGEYINKDNVRHLVTLKNAKIYSYATNCECETTPSHHEVNWLNIFSEDIIAFSFVENA